MSDDTLIRPPGAGSPPSTPGVEDKSPESGGEAESTSTQPAVDPYATTVTVDRPHADQMLIPQSGNPQGLGRAARRFGDTATHLTSPTLPPFLSEQDLKRFVQTSDGVLKMGKIIVKSIPYADTHTITIPLVGPEGQHAGGIVVKFELDSFSREKKYINSFTWIEINPQFRGRYYATELRSQLIRYLYLNPEITETHLEATEDGRHMWVNSDGFVLSKQHLTELTLLLSEMGVDRKRILKLGQEDGPRSPFEIANSIIYASPVDNLIPFARDALRESRWEREGGNIYENKINELARYPCKIALLLLGQAEENLKFKATLDLRPGSKDYVRYERSIARFWSLRGLPIRMPHLKESFDPTKSGHERPALNITLLSQIAEKGQKLGRKSLYYPKEAIHARYGWKKDPDNPAKESYVQIIGGIRSWDDLYLLFQKALEKSSDDQSIVIEVDLSEMPTLTPPIPFREKMRELIEDRARSQLTVVIRGDPMEPPVLYMFDREGVRTSLKEIDEKPFHFWIQDSVRQKISEQLADKPGLQLLLDILESDEALQWESMRRLGPFLAKVIEIYNARAGDGITPIPTDKQTKIFGLLEELRAVLIDAAKNVMQGSIDEWPATAIYWNPVDKILREHPADPHHVWFSIGAGQMISTLEFTRGLMDRGILPLDFKLIAFARNPATVVEINREGTNHRRLKETAINTSDRRRIHVLHIEQLNEALLTYLPEAVLFNIPAGQFAKVFDDDMIEVLHTFNPVTATPAKAYFTGEPDEEGRDSYTSLIPYLDLYLKLKDVAPELAERLIVMGGFFEAPKILQGRQVDMTLAGGSRDALTLMAARMSPYEIDINLRADWEKLNLKVIPSVAAAAFLMAGGANKNFLTNRTARQLMRKVLDTQSGASRATIGDLYDWLTREIRKNVDIGEEITARVMRHYGIPTDHLWTPKGLYEDYKNCLPQSLQGLIDIQHTLAQILLITNEDNLLRQLRELIENIKNNSGFGPNRSQPGGTRNARSGYIAEIIRHVYVSLKPHGFFVEHEGLRSFYEDLYPGDLLKDNGETTKQLWIQEGEKGILQLLQFAQKHEIALPKEVYEAAELYGIHSEGYYKDEFDDENPLKLEVRDIKEKENANYRPPEVEELLQAWRVGIFLGTFDAAEIEFPEDSGPISRQVSTEFLLKMARAAIPEVIIHQLPGEVVVHYEDDRAWFLPENFRERDEVWGLPVAWVLRLGRYISKINHLLFKDLYYSVHMKMPPDQNKIGQSLDELYEILKPLGDDNDFFPEVNARLVVIRDRVNDLITIFDEQMISDEILIRSMRKFKESLDIIGKIFTERVDHVSELLDHLRLVAQKLYDSQLEIQRVARVQLGYMSQFTPLPAIMSGRPIRNDQAGTGHTRLPPASTDVPTPQPSKPTESRSDPEGHASTNLNVIAGGAQYVGAGDAWFDGTAALQPVLYEEPVAPPLKLVEPLVEEDSVEDDLEQDLAVDDDGEEGTIVDDDLDPSTEDQVTLSVVSNTAMSASQTLARTVVRTPILTVVP